MSDQARMKTAELGPAAREFLFALAYWVATADHELREVERQWIQAEFGEPFVRDMLPRLSSMQPSRLRGHVRELRRRVPSAELSVLTESVRPWLRELVFVDRERAVNEALVAAIVLKMLGIKVPAKRRAASFADVRPFKGWPNPLTTSSRSNWDIH